MYFKPLFSENIIFFFDYIVRNDKDFALFRLDKSLGSVLFKKKNCHMNFSVGFQHFIKKYRYIYKNHVWSSVRPFQKYFIFVLS